MRAMDHLPRAGSRGSAHHCHGLHLQEIALAASGWYVVPSYDWWFQSLGTTSTNLGTIYQWHDQSEENSSIEILQDIINLKKKNGK